MDDDLTIHIEELIVDEPAHGAGARGAIRDRVAAALGDGDAGPDVARDAASAVADAVVDHSGRADARGPDARVRIARWG